MRDLSTLDYHDTSEKLVQVLCSKTQNTNPIFFRILVAYYFAKCASMMRTNIKTHDRGIIPVNVYAMNLATSGAGKGHSTNIVEEHVINQFKERFLEQTFRITAETNLRRIANYRAIRSGEDPDEMFEKVEREFNQLGALLFSFDSGTTAAVKQMRHKLLMANCGSMNLEIDEIGSNLLGQVEVMNTYLELYDVGKVKQKLIKNTADNVRNEDIDGKTPTNLMLFGTPSKLFDGARVESEFMSMLETGYARRCIFGYIKAGSKSSRLSAQEVYDMLTDTSTNGFLEDLSDRLGQLADPINYNKALLLSKDVSLLLIEYRLQCEEIAESLPEHDEVRKAEVSHRYFKALKLAGAYAFIDGSHEVTEDHLYNAIKLVEESGKAFDSMLTRDRNYVKLARYIAHVGREVTHVDLVEDLPFYKGSEAAKREMMNLAIAHGYKNNIIIKKMFNDGIEFLKGESLQETDLNAVTVAYGTDFATGYMGDNVPFDKLDTLTQQTGYHWVNHHMIDQHRKEENAIPGFNLVVIDVDEGITLDMVRLLMKDYKYHIYTTKRHQTPGNGDRFRIILPMNYTLKLDDKDFKEFMNNVYEWLPFKTDASTNQRSKKWQTYPGQFFYNDGELLDALLFIPKTTKNEERKRVIDSQQSLTNVERWFLNNTGIGNRSNQLIKYALMLVDSGMSIDQVGNAVSTFNSKLPDKMDEAEIMSTIMVTASKAVHKRDAAV